jgi:hypothetical protein
MDGIGKKTILMVFKNQIKVVGFIVKKIFINKTIYIIKEF